MSTYCVSKAKLLVHCKNIDQFRKGDFFRQPSADLQEVQLKGLLDVCQQSIQGRGFDFQKPFENIQIADAFHFAYLCHFSVVQHLFPEQSYYWASIEHAIMETKISSFSTQKRCIPSKNPFDKEVSIFQFPPYAPRIINASFSMKAGSKDVHTQFFILEACRSLNINISHLLWTHLKFLLVSYVLRNIFWKNNQNENGTLSEVHQKIFYVLFCWHTQNQVLFTKISVQQFEIL